MARIINRATGVAREVEISLYYGLCGARDKEMDAAELAVQNAEAFDRAVGDGQAPDEVLGMCGLVAEELDSLVATLTQGATDKDDATVKELVDRSHAVRARLTAQAADGADADLTPHGLTMAVARAAAFYSVVDTEGGFDAALPVASHSALAAKAFVAAVNRIGVTVPALARSVALDMEGLAHDLRLSKAAGRNPRYEELAKLAEGFAKDLS